MTDLIIRTPESRPDKPARLPTLRPLESSPAERLLTTQSPQRPLSTPAIRIEVDGRVVEGLEGEHGFALHDHALTIAVWVPAVLSIKPVVGPGEGEAS